MSITTQRKFTAEEYLSLERKAEYKSQFLRGEIFAMTGASRAHNLISHNIGRILGQQLQNRPCEVYQSDMRVKVDATGLYTYPDVVVARGKPAFEDNHVDTLLNPTLIVEVHSKSTETYDRGTKFGHYRQIESLQAYLLVAQDRAHVELFTRQGSDGWLLWETSGLETFVELKCIDCRLSLSDVYHKVDFQTVEDAPNL